MIKPILSWLKRTALAVMLVLPLAAAAQTSDKPFSNEQLDQMLAQIALYPDSLLSQVLMAATYPEDFAQAAAWSKAHPDAKGDSAVTMVESEPWDPSVASLVAFPEVLITLGEKPGYVRDGLMTEGYALIAWPERWGDTGIMSFIASRDGVAYQKNLGPGTDEMRPRAR